ncbi:Xaa-Pro peptidase family protein (plasmid) [Natrinema zhouii]|uniref:M24 family metallopeptidase n=1 Tax=Natrinema zhouii TaxID=1710539 RepID=UPI001CFF6DE0|nr:Xaa-Pro peptidase family protein [Natrinema zhouii]UHQ98261.1 Xaa-Pro peptidase family protein [Natrinema zhouii]
MEKFAIPTSRIQNRKNDLLDYISSSGYDGAVVFGMANVQYLSNFFAIETQRPVALGITKEDTFLTIPEMDEIHVRNHDEFIYDDLFTYYEYPQSDPMQTVGEMCAELGIDDGRIAVDSDGPAHTLGFSGPSLSNIVPGEVVVEDYFNDLTRYKDETEIQLYREGGTWVNLAHRLLQQKIETGEHPICLAEESQTEAIRSMINALGDRYQLTSWDPPIQVTCTAGEENAYCHNLNQQKPIEEGDLIETFVMAEMFGYKTGKLERTMVVGEPSNEQRDYFEIMKEAQEILFDAIEPGISYGYTEDIIDDFFAEHGLEDNQAHRPGHGMGLSWLSRPFLDRGLEGEFSVGEVFTVEPAFYIPDIGGFRHCDTVTVTEDGIEVLTYYPRDLDDLTIPVE